MSSFLERQQGGYVTASAFVLGVGLHSCFSCCYLLYSKAATAKNGWIWKLSAATLCSTFLFLLLQMIVLDFMTSPYACPDYFVGLIELLNYLMHFISAVGITTVIIIRLTVFYAKDSYLLITMYVLAGLITVTKLVGDSLGILTSISIMRNEYLRYDDHPYFKYSNPILGASTIIDLIFSVLGSLGFIFALSANNAKKTFLKDVLIKHHGYRLIVVCVVHVCICVFSVYSVNNVHTAITRVGMYLPSAVIAFELNTFLELSYVTAKAIITTTKDIYSRSLSDNGKMY